MEIKVTLTENNKDDGIEELRRAWERIESGDSKSEEAPSAQHESSEVNAHEEVSEGNGKSRTEEVADVVSVVANIGGEFGNRQRVIKKRKGKDRKQVVDKKPRGIKTERWQPKKWNSSYEKVVLMDVQGFPQSVIAETVGYSEMHISNILKSDRGIAERKLIIETVRKKTTEEIPDRLARLADKALKRVEQTMDDDDLYNNAQLAVTDRALKLLEKGSIIKSDTESVTNSGNTTNITNNITIEQVTVLNNAAQQAMEARRMYENKLNGAVVGDVVKKVSG